MSTLKTNNVQVGQSVTATNNFTLYQPSSPDGTVRLGNGNSGSVTDVMSFTSAGVFAFNSGYGSVAPAYGCRAWVNFNGQGAVAIRASGNVSSITDVGTGSYRVNFSTAMPAANYAAVASAGNVSSNSNFGINVNTATTTTIALLCIEAGAATDKSEVFVAVFR